MNQSVMSDSSPTVRLPNLALASSIQSLPHVGLPAAPTQDNKQDDNVRSLRDDVDGGWSWVVMVSVAFTFFISNGYGYTFGVFYLPILETFEEGETMTSVVGSIYIGLSQLAGILASVLCDKINCRMTCIIGSVATAVGLGCSTFATSCTFLIISMGIIAGSGRTLMYTASLISLSYYFNVRRPFAISMVHVGSSLGQLVWGPLSHFLLDVYSWRGVCLIQSAFSLHAVAMGILLRPHKYEQQHREHSGREKHGFSLALLRDRSFVLLILNFTCVTTVTGMLLVHYVPYCVQSGTSEHKAAGLLSVIGITSLVLKPLVGGATTYPDIDCFTLCTMCQSIVGIGTLLLPLFVGQYIGQFCYAVFFGIYTIPFFIGDTAIMAETVKTEYLGTAMGVLVCASGIGFAFGPLLGGLIFSLTGAYAKAMQTAGGSLLASTLLMFLVKVKVKCTETRPGSTTSVDDVELEKDPNNSD
ncbi:monocarboxylate transporter 13-like isoform X1 [Lingula anatina]|uniref:Monocarboxylate transporter 13-like isoform X1 n=1 Tax=Lingula anatina TaxID=7574 RepID=A0A1S3HUB3_LINAN|nr:monocarboxylate transporter 13-like isoform X1 [Lingula anatina]XP_013389629.1 monocarboxylate transporter 13-like isoform X1 [Lingula anatina]XP_013389630.1 monocarboxylate transporter 13-like isoform X1 [Lingula anatina]XP_013389631.1 monocarboxylate transporter 13-like isoform X1 [Lingula anatina]XP_013389632.1 monocarboxylate transporter 13-like isoform X1 [Lingula anatina]|eukprot:XP_013389628.1 monocarboxylate transporter 13-like isoform X1 [Lingula anatina]